jgi:hypothetical protein
MTKVALLERIVRTPTKSYKFAVEVHESFNPDSRLLPESFYKTGDPPTIPEGRHHEMLLTAAPAYGRINPDVAIHVYTLPGTNQHFVCWTMPVLTLEAAREFFEWWCLGTVYSIEHDRDFGDLLVDHADDMPDFLKKEYGIEFET